ncbi:hypothetical protein JCM10908_001106 [Rhodotorula pacifica]|uniref:uncharacterized protein n=1 Tax=Rhodotorula pacifica TaxID=1495444 RepID=UPI00317F8B41
MTTRSRTSNTTLRPRRVLAQQKDRVGLAPSSTSSVNKSTLGSLEVAKPPATSGTTRARRLSRVEASQITGMGVVRAGPAVIGHRSPSLASTRSTAGSHPPLLDTGSTSDPFSTAFVRPPLPFTSEATDSAGGGSLRQFKPLPSSSNRPTLPGLSSAVLSPLRESTSPGTLRGQIPTSPSALLQSARIAPHSPTRSPSRIFRIFEDGAAAMDTDDKLPTYMAPTSSDAPGTVLPLGTYPVVAASSRKRSAGGLDSDEPEASVNAATPSKRAAKRVHVESAGPNDAELPSLMAAAEVAQAACTTAETTRSLPMCGTPLAPSPTLVRPSPRSVPMQRTAGRVYGLPDLTALSVPTSPRLFVPRAQIVKASANKQNTSDETLSSLLPSHDAKSVVQAPSAPEAVSSEPGPSLIATLEHSLPLRHDNISLPSPPAPCIPPSISSPTATAPVSSNLILPTLSLFDPDRSASDGAPAIDGDTTMSDVGDMSTISSSTGTSSRADETARRLANLQSMLSRLQVPKPAAAAAAPTTGTALSSSRRISVGVNTASSRISSSSSMAPPAVASNTARRASMARAKASAAAVSGSASAPTLHRGSPLQPGSANAARRKSIAGPTVPSGTSKTSSQGLGTSALRTSSAGNVQTQGTTQRAARGKTCLQGVVAFVDVRTAEGDDSGMIFVDMLKDLGARVTSRPSSLTTHIVFKSGKPATLDFYRQSSLARRPHLVGIAWVVRCSELHTRVEESLFKIDEAVGASAAPGGGKENVDAATATAQAALGLSANGGKKGDAGVKRRKSMEPRALAALNNARANLSLSTSNDSAMKASIAASIERARRKSLQYAPRVGSPLAKRVFVMPDPVEEE